MILIHGLILFKEAGAKYVIPTAEHHDGFALYDSKLTRWDAKDMGPKRDLIGDLAKAVEDKELNLEFLIIAWNIGILCIRRQQQNMICMILSMLIFMVPHRNLIKNKASAMGPSAEEVMEGKEAPQDQGFLEEWLARCQEIIDKYQPDILLV